MSDKRNWIVRAECVILKDIYVEDCTEEEARNDPFKYSVDEAEVDQIDWTVKSVTANGVTEVL